MEQTQVIKKIDKRLVKIDDPVFTKAFEALIKKEGGYINNKSDSGGETKYGISKKAYPNINILKLTTEEAKTIYYFDYWLPSKCSVLPPMIACKFFDMCVNMGRKQATKLLQRAIRANGITIAEDGIIGPQTLAPLKNCKGIGEMPFVSALRSESAGYYKLLVAKTPNLRIFLDGWINRAYA